MRHLSVAADRPKFAMPHGKKSTSKLISVVRAALHACDYAALGRCGAGRSATGLHMLSTRVQEVGEKFAAYFFEI